MKDVFDDSYLHEYNHVMYAGDFNIALNHELDTSDYLDVNNPQSRQHIKSRIATNELIDIGQEKITGRKAFIFGKKPDN